MRYYPLFLDLRGRRCVVVGGGKVAERRVQLLVRAGAAVRVISPVVTSRLAQLAAKKRIRLTRRAYRKGDLNAGAQGLAPLLVFAATNDPRTQRAISRDAQSGGALVNAADDRERSNFLVPASFSQGGLQVAISTSGASPALARALRRRLQEVLGGEYRAYVQWLRRTRKQVRKAIPNQRKRTRILRKLVSGLLNVDRIGRKQKAEGRNQKSKGSLWPVFGNNLRRAMVR